MALRFFFKGGFYIKSRLFVFLLLTFIVRIIFLCYSDNGFNGDSASRLYFSYMWYRSPSIMVGYDWLPLHFYMLGIPIAIFKETVWTPRIVTVIVGVLTVFPFFSLVKRIFGAENAWSSLLIFALLPSHIVMSVVTLSEVPFIFFLLYALDFTFRFLRSSSYRDLIAVIAFLSMSNFIRFEGWIFTVLILLLFFYEKVPFKLIALYVTGISIPIIYVLIASWLGTDDPFWGLNESDRFVLDSLKGVNPFVNAKDISDAFIALWIVFFPLGLYKTIKEKEVKRYLYLLMIPFTYTLFKIMTLSLTGQYRYLITTSVLSIPFVAMGISVVIHYIFKRNTVIRTTAIATTCILLCTVKYNKMLIAPIMPGNIGKFYPGFISSALWVKDNVKNARVVVDADNFSNYAWMVYAEKIIKDNDPKATSYAVMVAPDCWKDSTAISTIFYNILKKDHVTHLVLFKNGNISAQLHFKRDSEMLKDIKFKKLYDYNEYRVYEVL